MKNMKSSLTKIFIFTFGVAIGSAVTWKLVKTKYEQIANEEIESVKNIYRNKEYQQDIKNYDMVKSNEDLKEYNVIVKENYNKIPKVPNTQSKPYVISPDKYGELDGFKMLDLTYYADGFLVDDQDELVNNIEEIIGWENLNHFDEYEKDAVHVRNDELKIDCEIFRDVRNYRDVVKEEQEE